MDSLNNKTTTAEILPNVLLNLVGMGPTEEDHFLDSGNGQKFKRVLDYRHIDQGQQALHNKLFNSAK